MYDDIAGAVKSVGAIYWMSSINYTLGPIKNYITNNILLSLEWNTEYKMSRIYLLLLLNVPISNVCLN